MPRKSVLSTLPLALRGRVGDGGLTGAQRGEKLARLRSENGPTGAESGVSLPPQTRQLARDAPSQRCSLRYLPSLYR